MKNYIIGIVCAVLLVGCSGALDDIKDAVNGDENEERQLLGTWKQACNKLQGSNRYTDGYIRFKNATDMVQEFTIYDDKLCDKSDTTFNYVTTIESEYTVGDSTSGSRGESATELNSVITKSETNLANSSSDFIRVGRSVYSMFILNGNQLLLPNGSSSRLGFTADTRINDFGSSVPFVKQ